MVLMGMKETILILWIVNAVSLPPQLQYKANETSNIDHACISNSKNDGME